MITCINQTGNGMTNFDIHHAHCNTLLDIVCKNVVYGCTIFIDEYSAYNQLQKHGFIHESVTFRKGIRKRHRTRE
jgi:hypothetical protein